MVKKVQHETHCSCTEPRWRRMKWDWNETLHRKHNISKINALHFSYAVMLTIVNANYCLLSAHGSRNEISAHKLWLIAWLLEDQDSPKFTECYFCSTNISKNSLDEKSIRVQLGLGIYFSMTSSDFCPIIVSISHAYFLP